MRSFETAQDKEARTPLILLVNPSTSATRRKLSRWLASHPFTSYEASDTLDAIGLISDFTTESMPQIVTIPQGDREDVFTVSKLLNSFITDGADLPVFLYSHERNDRARSISTEEIGQWFERQGDHPVS